MGKKPAIKRIGITFNLKQGKNTDACEEYDEIETIEALEKEISLCGFKVVRLSQDSNFLENISRAKVDFVFNIAEGVGPDRGRESQVPCILESLDIPYSGSGPVALAVALDKYLTNIVLKSSDLPVPEAFMIQNQKQIAGIENIFRNNTRFIVKPRWEGSSKGIFLHSAASNIGGIKKIAGSIISKYKQPAIAEEFLPGEEITAGVCGNNPCRVLGMMRISPRDKNYRNFIYSIENKRDWETKIEYEPASSIPVKTRDMVKNYALKAFAALELRDIARIDFRLDAKGVPKIIDVNPLPGLSPRYSDLPILCRLSGINYSSLVRLILKESLKRCGIENGAVKIK